MAGSYRDAVDDTGALRDIEAFRETIENLGDAYEMAEEMYGMIWYLADALKANIEDADVPGLVDEAMRQYQLGLRIAEIETGGS